MRDLVTADADTDAPLGAICRDHLDGGGKRLRARLALAATQVLGVQGPDPVLWAAACELVHNATLIHDDLQDGDRIRRGLPATWVTHGAAQAINAGDLLLMLPIVAVGRLAAPLAQRWGLAQLLADSLVKVIRGQGLECSLAASGRTDWEIYRRTIEGKTCALFALPVQGAALLAGHSGAAAASLARPFAALGALFQMQDDVLDLYGEKGRDRPGSDLREGKISALVVAHLQRQPADREWLLRLLRAPREATDEDEVQAAIVRFRTSGALAAVLAEIAAEARAAEQAVTAEMRGLLGQLTERILRPIAHLQAA